MRNPLLPGIVLFYSILALILAVILILVRQPAVLGAHAGSLANACENLALITIALGVWVERR